MTIRGLSALLGGLVRPKAEAPVPSRPPTRRARVIFALTVGLLSACYCLAYAYTNPDFTSDFDQVWGAGRALLAGQNPYEVVGPGKPYHWYWPFYYPLPAVLVTLPVAYLPVEWARTAFSGISAGLMAWAISRESFARWPVFISISFVTAIELSQWSPLLLAAMLMPALGFLAVAKPNLGVAVAAQARSNRALVVLVGGSLILAVASFVILPHWFNDWLRLVRSATHFRAPITRPFGFLILLSLLRWRRPEARLLVALSLVPQTPTFYDHVFVFAAARTFREALTLTVGTFVIFFIIGIVNPAPTFQGWGSLLARSTVYVLYLPAVVMVLRRPNEGELPAVVTGLESLLRRGLRRERAA